MRSYWSELKYVTRYILFWGEIRLREIIVMVRSLWQQMRCGYIFTMLQDWTLHINSVSAAFPHWSLLAAANYLFVCIFYFLYESVPVIQLNNFNDTIYIQMGKVWKNFIHEDNNAVINIFSKNTDSWWAEVLPVWLEN